MKPLGKQPVAKFTVFLLLVFFIVPLVAADSIETDNNFNFDPYTTSYQYQDLANNNTITWTITSGNLTGTGNVNTNSLGGVLYVYPTSSGVIHTSSVIGIYLFYNGVNATSTSYTFTSGNGFTIAWSYAGGSVGTSTWYFQSSTHTVNSITAYDLTQNKGWQSASASQTFSGEGAVTFSFKAYLVHSDSEAPEPVFGDGSEYVAELTRYISGSGIQSASASCNSLPMVINLNAIQVNAYVSFNGGEPLMLAQFITSRLMEKQLNSATWTFNFYTQAAVVDGDTVATLTWGNQLYVSGIGGLSFVDPTPQEIALATGLGGDIVGMIIYPFSYIIGEGLFLGLLLLFGSGTLYFRHNKFTVILIMFLLWGSASGLGLLLPVDAYRTVYILILLGLTAVIYKFAR